TLILSTRLADALPVLSPDNFCLKKATAFCIFSSVSLRLWIVIRLAPYSTMKAAGSSNIFLPL
ncbi:MAG: hypothetical protein ACK53L_30310, partial [Pirellulaceae bacterium]